MLQKSVAVNLVTPEPREVAVRSLVSPPGVRAQDAVRNARAFLRDACVPVPGCQLADDVRVHCLRPARVTGSVRPLGSGLGSLPVRGFARGAHHRGRVALSRGSRGSGRGGMSFLEARDQLRAFAATPLKCSRVPRVPSLPSSRTFSGSGSVPEGSGVTTPTSPGTSSTSAASVGDQVLQVDFQKQNSSGFVSSSVMPLEALCIASNSIAESTKSKYRSVFLRFQKYGRAKGVNILTYSFSQILFIGFLLSIYTNKSSLGFCSWNLSRNFLRD